MVVEWKTLPTIFVTNLLNVYLNQMKCTTHAHTRVRSLQLTCSKKFLLLLYLSFVHLHFSSSWCPVSINHSHHWHYSLWSFKSIFVYNFMPIITLLLINNYILIFNLMYLFLFLDDLWPCSFSFSYRRHFCPVFPIYCILNFIFRYAW